MIKNIYLISVLVALVISAVSLFSGCMNKKELEKLAFVTCIEVSMTEFEQEKPVYVLSAEILKNTSSAGEGDSMENAIILSAQGESIDSCFHKIEKFEKQDLYLGHLRVIILNKSMMNRVTLKEVSDFVLADEEIRFNTLLIFNEGESPILSINESNQQSQGIEIYDKLKSFNDNTDLAVLIDKLRYNDFEIAFNCLALKDISGGIDFIEDNNKNKMVELDINKRRIFEIERTVQNE